MTESGDNLAISLETLVEFFCRAMLVAMLLSRFIDGPSVSPDQLAFRYGAALVAAAGAIGLHVRRHRERRWKAE